MNTYSLDLYRSRLLEIRKQAQSDYDSAPDGRLDISLSRGHTQYRWVKPDESISYLGKNDLSTKMLLAQKSYARKVLRMADQELHRVNQAIAALRENSNAAPHPHFSSDCPAIEQIHQSLPKPRKELVTPYIYPSEDYLRDWESTQVEPERIFGQGLIFKTEKGEYVRSKSEVIIADRLFHADIPYKYERPLELDSITLHPDFTILVPGSRSELIWEHFGIMDDTEYCNKCMRKLNTYAQHGILPGNGMITTFETSATPLSTLQIDKIIESLSSNTWCLRPFGAKATYE